MDENRERMKGKLRYYHHEAIKTRTKVVALECKKYDSILKEGSIDRVADWTLEESIHA